jgi:glycerate 2-kinase
MTSEPSLIKNRSSIMGTEKRETLLSSIESTFSKMDPARRVEEAVHEHIKGNSGGDIYAIGFGKASLSMYIGLRRALTGKIKKAMITVPEGIEQTDRWVELELLHGTHPRVSEKSCSSTGRILDLIRGLKKSDILVTLISGGGSALFEYPENWITVNEMADISDCLMGNGANIKELNAIRIAMSQVKGGKLLTKTGAGKIYDFLISDVPGDDPALIASGPLVQPKIDRKQTLDIIGRYIGNCPGLKKVSRNYSYSPIPSSEWDRIHTSIIERNSDFIGAFMEKFTENGFPAISIGSGLSGNVIEFSSWIVEKAREIYKTEKKPFWFVGGGETTSRIVGKGKGGRNCELALRVMQKFSNEEFLFSSIGTDGMDGNSGAMGGIADNDLKDKVTNNEIEDSLSRSDSFSLLDKYSSAIITGFTGTNVSDIIIGYYGGPKH